MPSVPFESLPDDARLWIFTAAEALDAQASARLLEATGDFVSEWKAHGTPLTAARTLVEDRFLLVAVDQASVPPSGCSIDAMVRVLKGLENELEVALVSHGAVYARPDDGGKVERFDRKGFRAAGEAGRIDPDTPVFDTTLTEVGAYRAGRFEIPAREGWQATLLP